MINRKILYYPNIVVPTRWLRWALFYWDEVSSIVPYSWKIRAHRDMKLLYDESEFVPTRPDSLIQDAPAKVSSFHSELLEVLDTAKFKSIIRKDWLEQGYVGKIHETKVSRKIIESLKQRSLAKKKSRNSVWYIIEKETSLVYMALLAKYLADLDLESTTPSTDIDFYEEISYNWSDKSDRFHALNVKFLDVLPVPRDDVPLKDIIKFKKERKTELLSLREIIDSYHKELSNSKDHKEIKEITVQFKERIQKGKTNLEQNMKDSNIKRVFETFGSLISIKSPSLYEVIGFTIAQVPLEVSVPITATTAAIQIGTKLIDSRNKHRAEMRESPFSYLCYAQKKGFF